MAGPALDPKKVQQFERGFNGEDPQKSPRSLAGMLAQSYAAKANGQPSPAPQALSPINPHVQAMQEAAEAAKQKYMLENGVDENGDAIQK